MCSPHSRVNAIDFDCIVGTSRVCSDAEGRLVFAIDARLRRPDCDRAISVVHFREARKNETKLVLLYLQIRDSDCLVREVISNFAKFCQKFF